MRVTMMLADHAQVAEGKLYISGGGWSLTGPGPVTCGVALLFYVPWDRTNRKTTFTLRLVDADGHAVTQPGPIGTQPIQVGGQFEVGRPAGVPAGMDITVPIAINTAGLQLPPGKQFAWVLAVDGHPDDDWRLSFATRELPPNPLPPQVMPPALES
jgi:hypothetical protein